MSGSRTPELAHFSPVPRLAVVKTSTCALTAVYNMATGTLASTSLERSDNKGALGGLERLDVACQRH
jgi:hypothetical protein